MFLQEEQVFLIFCLLLIDFLFLFTFLSWWHCKHQIFAQNLWYLAAQIYVVILYMETTSFSVHSFFPNKWLSNISCPGLKLHIIWSCELTQVQAASHQWSLWVPFWWVLWQEHGDVYPYRYMLASFETFVCKEENSCSLTWNFLFSSWKGDYMDLGW